MAERLGVADRVRFTGAVSDSALEELYRSHDVFRVPSQFEGFGLPAIGSSRGGATDIIREGENGFLVEPGASRDLAERLRSLRDLPRLWDRG